MPLLPLVAEMTVWYLSHILLFLLRWNVILFFFSYSDGKALQIEGSNSGERIHLNDQDEVLNVQFGSLVCM